MSFWIHVRQPSSPCFQPMRFSTNAYMHFVLVLKWYLYAFYYYCSSTTFGTAINIALPCLAFHYTHSTPCQNDLWLKFACWSSSHESNKNMNFVYISRSSQWMKIIKFQQIGYTAHLPAYIRKNDFTLLKCNIRENIWANRTVKGRMKFNVPFKKNALVLLTI